VSACSCGEGEIGHTTTHESTDMPGIVRLVREGKTDQYMNIKATRSRAASDNRKYEAEQERKRMLHTPRVAVEDRPSAFGTVVCRTCNGTGGNQIDKCWTCSGTGTR